MTYIPQLPCSKPLVPISQLNYALPSHSLLTRAIPYAFMVQALHSLTTISRLPTLIITHTVPSHGLQGTAGWHLQTVNVPLFLGSHSHRLVAPNSSLSGNYLTTYSVLLYNGLQQQGLLHLPRLCQGNCLSLRLSWTACPQAWTLLSSCPRDIASGQTTQKTPFLTVFPLLHDVAIHADHTENIVSRSTSICCVVWHLPLLHHCILCHFLAMAVSAFSKYITISWLFTEDLTNTCNLWSERLIFLKDYSS